MTATAQLFGTGIICPFQRDQKGDFAHASGLRVLSSDIGQLLGIIGPGKSQPGELPWRTDLGSRLVDLKHRRLHSEMIRAMAEQQTSGTVRRWDPRVIAGPTTVDVGDAAGNENLLLVRFSYTPRTTKPGERQSVDVPLKE